MQIPVPDLDKGLAFYREHLGHELIWRTESQAGLRMPDTDTELVIQTERDEPEVDFLVESTPAAVETVKAGGGKVLVEPFEIPVGVVAVVEDPFHNPLVILDLSKGTFVTDESGHVTGVSPGN